MKTRMFQVVLWPFYLILRWVYKKSLLQTFDGIKICDIASSDDVQRQAFCVCAVKALELIKEHDLKRYCRVQRHFAYILNYCIMATGSYNHSFRSCEINFSSFKFEGDEEWEVFAFACVLIHEATHGVVRVRSIPYNEKYRLRTERLCHQEEVRFARRVMPDVDLGDFDEKEYEDFFQMSRWQYAVKALKNAFRTNEPIA